MPKHPFDEIADMVGEARILLTDARDEMIDVLAEGFEPDQAPRIAADCRVILTRTEDIMKRLKAKK